MMFFVEGKMQGLFLLGILVLLVHHQAADGQCNSPDDVENADLRPDQPTFLVNDTVNYTCDTGYQHTAGDLNRTCLLNGTWTGDAPHCSVLSCAAPPMPPHASNNLTQSIYNYSDVIGYTCDTGYETLSGNASRICLEDGSWSGAPLNCSIIRCTAPPIPPHASSNQIQIIYNYDDIIDYTCDTGYVVLSGNVSRVCLEDGNWSGDPISCSITTCAAPPIPPHASSNYTQFIYNYSDVIGYTCDTGYETLSGNASRMCLEGGSWSGNPLNCSIVTCDREPVLNGTTLSSQSVYNYSDIVTYICDVGYNHSAGDLTRNCTENGSWNGILPVCEIVQCLPPDDVDHATYDPDAIVYDWRTAVEYACDPLYHHVDGHNITVCNESGVFPPVDVNCSVMHFLKIDSNTPSVVWLNSSITSAVVYFDFDGICDVTLMSNPPYLVFNHSIKGGNLSVMVSANGQTVDGSYVVTVEPKHDGQTWAAVPFNVYFGNYINGFQAYLYNNISTIAVWRNYSYHVNATPYYPADVFLTAIFEVSGHETTNITGLFTNHTFTYAFTQTGHFNISFSGSNPVTEGVYSFLEVNVIAPVNSLEILFDTDLISTDYFNDMNVQFNSTTVLPMEEVQIFIDYGNSTLFRFNDSLYENISLPYSNISQMYYDIQGNYNITVTVINIVSSRVVHKVIQVWDNITDTTLQFVNTTNYFITGDTFVVEFQNVTRSGFEYQIDFTDGTAYSSSTSDILYQNYTHETFSNSYSQPAVYHIRWIISNGAYNISGLTEVMIENTVKGLSAWLLNPISSIEVDRVYTYEANGTEGSNTTTNWQMDDGSNQQNVIVGEFTTDSITHAYTSPGEYNVSLTVSNLVSAETVYFPVSAFYKPNNIDFVASKTVSNISSEVDFSFLIRNTASLPMKQVNYTIDFIHNSSSVSGMLRLDQNATLPMNITESYTFTTQGDYNVTARFENILGYIEYTILVRIWDGLADIDFVFVGDNGVYITNETARFEFVNPPNGGHLYVINYDDGTVVQYTDEEIYYREHNLTVFEHAYGSPGVYTLTWQASNKQFTKTDRKIILVQNPIPSHSFTLEPGNKKYPWINLQNMSISLNITLNDTVATPTNATCVFYPGDGKADITGLVFMGSFFEHHHFYLSEGTFRSYFNCSNLVSYYIYEYNVTVQKFRSEFVTLDYAEVVPLNRSDTVEVFFHVKNQDFALIPYEVEFDFNFGDGLGLRKKRAVEVYEKPTYTHTYTERGNYTVTLSVNARVTNTQTTSTYSIRVGTMYFKYSDVIAYINHTLVLYEMHGVLGSSTVYTLDFVDNTPYGSCNSQDYNGCTVDHYCPFYGYKNVTVTANNGTFVEIDWINITCDNPITVGLDVPWTVSIPDGSVELKLYLNESALYLPVLNIQVHMGDPINRDTYNFTEEVSYEDPFVFPFNYIALGRHTITVFCWNLINETSFETKITVTNENFLFTGSFDRKYSQVNSPMYLTSMRDLEIFSRLVINSNHTVKTHFNLWSMSADPDQPMNRHGLIFTIGLVEEKKYLIQLSTSFIEEPSNIIREPTYVEFVVPPPHVEIVGGARRMYPGGSTFIDAATLSYDPAKPDERLPIFAWHCVGYSASSFDRAEIMHLNSTNGETCQVVNFGNGTLMLETYLTPDVDYFILSVTASNTRSVQSSFTQILRVTASFEPLSIRCKINCLAKVGVTSHLQLVPDVPHNCPASYEWAIHNKVGPVVNTSYDLLPDLLSANLTETDGFSRTLTIKPNAFSYGSTYIVTLTMTYSGVRYGPAYHEFKTNLKPKGGMCDIIPYDEQLRELPVLNNASTFEARAATDLFNLTCEQWTDEGFTDSTFTTKQPLFYYFFTRFENDVYKRQILYYDPGSTSNLVTFQVGDPNNEYKLQVVLRIVDLFGDYEELVYTVKSEPDPSITSESLNNLTDTGQVNIVKPYLAAFTDELIKANRTWDYRTLSRKITGITSVYNNVELNGTTSKVIAPEELTNLGSDGELGWSDYWKIVVEAQESLLANYLIKVSEEYVGYLYESVTTWPSERRMTLPTIQTIGRAVSASLDKIAYSNVTAAIMAAKIADTLAFNLANNVEDRTFPITWSVLSAVDGLKDLCHNILAELQAVLTPNLPEDPTADEMRHFLEYIKVFQVEDETNQYLSLQEQTFLAQKQLQRYYLDRYIKSRASREALPYLTFALRNLTLVLSKLTDIGQPAYIIESDFFYLSAEIVPANLLKDSWVSRPRVGVGVTSLTLYETSQCDATAIPVQTTVFKENPYFWGQFADRITSYVPVFQFGDAKLGGSTLMFRLENKVTPECFDETPTYTEGDDNKMIYILFNRKFAEDDILIFIRPNTTELIYEVYLNTGEKPDIVENVYEFKTTMQRDANYTLEDGHKLLIKSSSFGSTGKIWIGLKPILENSDDVSLLNRPFCANVTSVSCLSWVENANGDYYWDKDACEVSTSSTKTDTICECQNTNKTMTVGTTFLVPSNKIDFNRESRVEQPIGRSPVVGLVVSVILLYFVLLIWAWREDGKDQYKWSYSLLIDNDIADQYFYILRVFTGMRSSSGTKSNIAFILAGERSDTGIRMLDDQSHIGFETGSVRTFVMGTRRRLGDLMSMRIWHDDTGGNEASWFLNKITVLDLQTFNRFSLENFEASMAAVTFVTVLISIVCFFFRFARKKGGNKLNSAIHNFYRKLNNRINLDNSVLKSTFDPPAQKAVYHNFNFLPHMLTNVGWVLLFLIVLLTTMAMFLMTAGWTVEHSEEWITTVICGYLISFLILEPLKIAFIVLLYSLLCQRAYEPMEPYIDIEGLKEIAKYNSATLTISPDFSDKLQPAVSPDRETLLAHKSQRVQNHQLLKMFTQLALYSGILYLVYTISFESRDLRSYRLKANIEEMFQFKEEVTDIETYITWLNGHFINSYFASSFFGQTSNRTEASIRHFAKDLVNYRVGPARLRQLRVRPERCQGPLGDGRLCYSAYENTRASKRDYCLGWKPTPCALSEKSNFFTSPAWEYVSPDEIWGFITVAEYSSYGGGGYFMKLDVNRDVCQKIFEELQEHNWFDRATRAVILEFTLYNANTNLFVYSKFVAEFQEIGGVITFTDIQVFRLFTDSGSSGNFIKLLQFLFLILVIVAFIKIVYDMFTEGFRYFKSVWNLLDVLALIMSIVTISMYLFTLTIVEKTTFLFHADKNAYVGFENLAFYDFVVNTTHGILVFLLSVRVSRILGYSGKINEMAAVISTASGDLGAFVIIFGITYFAYVVMGTLLFGADNDKYKDLFNTYGTITEAIVGKNRLEKILVTKPGYAEFYYFTFVLFVLFTLTTMAAAILNFSITYVKEEQKKLAPTNIVEVIADRISKLISYLRNRSGSSEDKDKSSEGRDTQDQVGINDILLEFHAFIRNLETNKKGQMHNETGTPRKKGTSSRKSV